MPTTFLELATFLKPWECEKNFCVLVRLYVAGILLRTHPYRTIGEDGEVQLRETNLPVLLTYVGFRSEADHRVSQDDLDRDSSQLSRGCTITRLPCQKPAKRSEAIGLTRSWHPPTSHGLELPSMRWAMPPCTNAMHCIPLCQTLRMLMLW